LNNKIEPLREDYKQRHEELLNIKNELLRKRMEFIDMELEIRRIKEIKNSDLRAFFRTVSDIVRDTR
jgi:predicted  nucleic acid-binding Zn-ribbon protein